MLQKRHISRTQILRRAADDLRSGLPIHLNHTKNLYLYPAEFIHPRIENSYIDNNFQEATLYIRSNQKLFSVKYPNLSETKAKIYELIDRFVNFQALDLKPDDNDSQGLYVTSFLSYSQLLPIALVFQNPKIDSSDLMSIHLKDLTFEAILEDIDLIPGSKIKLPTLFGEFSVIPFRATTGEEHLAMVKDPIDLSHPVLVRVHSSCFTGDILTSLKCDCGPQIQTALSQINEHGSGLVLYLSQEGRGIGLLNKMRAYHLQSKGIDTVDANTYLGFEDDQRHFGIAKKMLDYLGINNISLITNNPRKVELLQQNGIRIAGRIPIKVGSNLHNVHYLNTKRDRSQHYL